MEKLPYGFARKERVLLTEEDGAHRLYFTPQTRLLALAEAQRFAAVPLAFEQLAPGDFDQALSGFYAGKSNSAQELATDMGDNLDLASLADSLPENADLMEQEDDAPVIRLINAMLSEAIKEDASDIHLETFDDRMSVRFRVDGVLREVVQPSRALAPLLISRLKVMARLDIAEKRLPQDGRISLRLAGREIDVRVSTIPANDSERVVLRLLDKQVKRLNFDALGMKRDDNERLEKLLHRPHGILLVTGPTGSGKTTTLYAGLQSIQNPAINILTIEDPVEYNLPGIGQTQVNLKAGMTFARGLRAILRQDPDVVMIGEIRDIETAQIAVQASLTGHLVLSTLHTNTAAGAVTRLADMGVEPFLLSSSLLGILAQRLVRVLCPECREPYPASDRERTMLGSATPVSLYRPRGCEQCRHQGYRGRTGIYELIAVDETLRQLIHDRAPESDLVASARQASRSIFDDARAKVLDGISSLDEVLRVTEER